MRPSFLTWLFSHVPWLAERWAAHYEGVKSADVPWTPLRKPLAQCRVALVTTAGVHLTDQPPFDMKDKQGDPSFRELPPTLEPGRWTITHDYYDHRDALADVNIVLPLDRLRELAAAGEIGEVAPRHFSFMGHIDGPHIPELTGRTAPQVAGLLQADRVDAAVLAPA
ncbi:MAG: hypothetical protein HYY25_05210 [Candidatus Wallbacteria bacterium]|nr:hypothetical protein [Candidatus Wallbacteria bacterium]MBI4869038.1 hypothetical protein [Candidatus Wallbacteria bacterium]